MKSQEYLNEQAEVAQLLRDSMARGKNCPALADLILKSDWLKEHDSKTRVTRTVEIVTAWVERIEDDHRRRGWRSAKLFFDAIRSVTGMKRSDFTSTGPTLHFDAKTEPVRLPEGTYHLADAGPFGCGCNPLTVVLYTFQVEGEVYRCHYGERNSGETRDEWKAGQWAVGQPGTEFQPIGGTTEDGAA